MAEFKTSNMRLEETANRKKNLGQDDWELTEEFLFKSDKKAEMYVKLTLSEMIGAVFETHKSLSKNLLEVTFKQILTSALG